MVVGRKTLFKKLILFFVFLVFFALYSEFPGFFAFCFVFPMFSIICFAVLFTVLFTQISPVPPRPCGSPSFFQNFTEIRCNQAYNSLPMCITWCKWLGCEYVGLLGPILSIGVWTALSLWTCVCGYYNPCLYTDRVKMKRSLNWVHRNFLPICI